MISPLQNLVVNAECLLLKTIIANIAVQAIKFSDGDVVKVKIERESLIP